MSNNIAEDTKKRRTKTMRRLFSRRWLQKGFRGRSILSILNKELMRDDQDVYKKIIRLFNSKFEHLLQLIEPDIVQKNTIIPPRTRLEITLRFLATGESFRSLMNSTQIHESTISGIIPKVLEAIYRNLKPIYLTTPTTEEEWGGIASNFEAIWQFPHCLGALGGRHITFRPPRSGSSYDFNYKDNSVMLLGMADTNHKFISVNVGVNYRESSLANAISTNRLNFPQPDMLPGRKKRTPYVILADVAFPLSDNIMKPFPPRGLTYDRRIFNYRLSRARRIIDNCFGVLTNRFRILLNPINLSATKVELITLVCVILHNYLIEDKDSRSIYLENTNGTFVENRSGLNSQCGNKSSVYARAVREEFKEYFCAEGVVDFQDDAVTNTNI